MADFVTVKRDAEVVRYLATTFPELDVSKYLAALPAKRGAVDVRYHGHRWDFGFRIAQPPPV
jgi:hypothetical protein